MKERLNALKVALDNELREHEFYLSNARRTRNDMGRAMFQQIAGEELEHHERLKQLSQAWEKSGKWPETVPLQVKQTLVRDILKDMVNNAAAAEKSDAGDLEALRTAIDFEAKGATYYANLAAQLTDPREKAFFTMLADIEHEHYASLKETEEYFTNPAGYYQRTERSGLDGA